jgi:excisionase family DNA binding protein
VLFERNPCHDALVSVRDYSAYVEVDARVGDDLDAVDVVMDALAAYHGTIGMSPRGYAFGLVTIPAPSLQQAAMTATLVVTAAFGDAEPIACEVMTTEEFDRRQEWAELPPLVSVTEAAEILGVSRTRIQQRIHDNSIQAQKVGNDYVIVRSSLKSRPPGRPRKRVPGS